MTIDEAFEELLNTRGMAKLLGISRQTFSSYKYDMASGRRGVSLDKKKELLEKAGWVVKIEVERPSATMMPIE